MRKIVVLGFFFCVLLSTPFAQAEKILSASSSKTKAEKKLSGAIFQKIPSNNLVVKNAQQAQEEESLDVYVDFTRGEKPENVPGAVKNIDEDYGIAVVDIPVSQILNFAENEEVHTIREILPPIVWTGSVNSQGDAVLRSDDVRNAFTKSGGEGVKIGVISDGVDHLVNAQATGDAPMSVNVLRNAVGGDEGTAMIEIIHDLAPDAEILFTTPGIPGAPTTKSFREITMGSDFSFFQNLVILLV